jgi:succinoglycan biosynthesis transport protein ExoP
MSFLRRYALWIVLATVACTAGSWAFAAHQPVQFTATAAVDVEASVIPGAAPAVPNLQTEEQVATSEIVLSAAAAKLGTSPSELLTHLSVTNKAGTNILTVACSEPTAAAATSCAKAVAAAYTAYRNETASSKATQARDPLHVAIVTLAPSASQKSAKRKLELVVLGLILGLALGVGTAFLRDRLDDRVRDRADLARCLNAPVLSDIPAIRGTSARPEASASHAPRSPLAEAYRRLRARIGPLIASTDSQGRVLLVTSAHPGEGRTSVAMNLAAVMAFGGTNVLLVDADLRNPTLSDELQARYERGLTDLLADRARIGDVITPANLARGLSFMSAGTVVDHPADLFDSARLQRIFSQLRVLADVVIVDSGPLRKVSDPLALVPVSDIVLVVADARRTRRAAVTAATQEIRESGSVAIVGVLNRVRQPWRLNLAPARDTRRTRSGSRKTGSATIEADPNSIPKAGWRNPAPAERTAGFGATRSVQPLVLGDEPLVTDGEELTQVTEYRQSVPDGEKHALSEDRTITLNAAELSRKHGADAAPSSNGTAERQHP